MSKWCHYASLFVLALHKLWPMFNPTGNCRPRLLSLFCISNHQRFHQHKLVTLTLCPPHSWLFLFLNTASLMTISPIISLYRVLGAPPHPTLSSHAQWPVSSMEGVPVRLLTTRAACFLALPLWNLCSGDTETICFAGRHRLSTTHLSQGTCPHLKHLLLASFLTNVRGVRASAPIIAPRSCRVIFVCIVS